MNAEIAVFHLRGLAMLVDALLELKNTSTYPRDDDEGSLMVLGAELRRLADSMLTDPLATDAPPATRQPPPRARPAPDDNRAWLTRRLRELGPS